jgi:cysteine synthase A
VELYAKLESRNPGGSLKDRMAYALIKDAECRGLLTPGQMVVEATSGNTGISLAMVCAALKYPFVAFMSDNFSVERRKLIGAYGARVVLVPAVKGATGRVRAAKEFASCHNAFMPCQYDNPANPGSHRETTAKEIIEDFAGRPLDWFVAGWGTGGTLTGVGEALKSARPELRVIAAEPARASVLQGNPWQPHKIQGWAPDFVPNDDVISVADDTVQQTVLALARSEGIFCGISSAACFAAALEVAKRAAAGDVILTIFADTGERYLSLLDDSAVSVEEEDDRERGKKRLG